MGRTLFVQPAPWEAERYRENVRKRKRQEKKLEKEQDKSENDGETREETTYSDEDEETMIGHHDMGTGSGAWPWYIRLMFIAGYRYVQKLDPRDFPFEKQPIFDAILRCCPSHRKSWQEVNGSQGENSNGETSRTDPGGGSFGYPDLGFTGGGLAGDLARFMLEPHLQLLAHMPKLNMYDERAVTLGRNRTLLDAVGLDAIAEVAIAPKECLPSSVARRVAKVMLLLKDCVPMELEDFEGTPYDPTDDYILDAQFRDIVIPLFEKALIFGDFFVYQD